VALVLVAVVLIVFAVLRAIDKKHERKGD